MRGATDVDQMGSGYGIISIHAPRAGGDALPLRPAKGDRYDFNPRPPCGGRRSICAPAPCLTAFQSTPPVRGATDRADIYPAPHKISIHAPRAGGDQGQYGCKRTNCHFNPRPPCGGRHNHFFRRLIQIVFQSTPPVRGATWHGWW